jgi:hypothetical protein
MKLTNEMLLLGASALLAIACSESGSNQPPAGGSGGSSPSGGSSGSSGAAGSISGSGGTAGGASGGSGFAGGGSAGASACTNGRRDGDETDLDCGGTACKACPVWWRCSKPEDCDTGACANGICRPTASDASCADGIRNGDESDVDCGGRICLGCAAGRECSGARDCETLLCSAGRCQTPPSSCSNGELDGDETDVDCGGPDCAPCRDGASCNEAADCRSRSCAGGACCDDTAILAWDSPTTNADGSCLTDLAGYGIYWGLASGSYTQNVLVPLDDPELYCARNGNLPACGAESTCTYTVTRLGSGTWYFATKSYNSGGEQSEFSGEVSKTVFPCP